MGRRKIEVSKVNGRFPRIMYGLVGIEKLFNVSKSTAFSLSRGILKDACTKNSGIMIIDTKKALELFGCSDPENFLEQ